MEEEEEGGEEEEEEEEEEVERGRDGGLGEFGISSGEDRERSRGKCVEEEEERGEEEEEEEEEGREVMYPGRKNRLQEHC